ncbi:trypsin-like peptidase domain-containing protein [Streptomyces sp. NPDC052701]|uniref:trypsin-like peptidase domain-containing protein n=1 Tax=Streptomyces sp. NPDC052701 TaxID=3155533 RepID=UPI003445EFE5
MNEGKPTKAKWWSRPRTQDAAGEPREALPAAGERPSDGPGLPGPGEATGAAAAGGVDGAYPAQDAVPVPAPTGAEDGRSTGADGDVGPERPGTAHGGGGHEGDFELARPAVRRDDAGDYTLERPIAADGGSQPAPDRGTADPAGGTAAAGAKTPAGAASADAGSAGTGGVPGAGAVPDALPVAQEATAPAGEAARPEPLHDPDPYSTPPYGGPGPWAPAPPVQHPVVTAAQGTTAPAPAPPPVPGAPVAPHGTPIPPPTAASTPPAAPAADAPAPAPDVPPPAPDPWRRYDPWAVPPAAGPLQQSGAAVAGEGQRRKRTRKALVGAAVLLALVSGGVGGVVGASLERNGGVGTIELPQAGKEPAGRAAGTVAGIAARALPSVVTLHVRGAGEQGTGTGFVLDTSGHILTNDHVVEPAGDDGEITVTFHSGDTAEASVVGRDSGYDLAVVKVKGVRGLTPLPLGNSDSVQVGDPVVAIGAPFDLAGTVTSGIISAKQRPITAGGEKGDGSDVSYVDALQTDAPINPGNSGGPLLDSGARVIGINSAIRSADSGADPDGGRSGSIGLGFAIPINQGKRVAEELINTGRATHPVIGITLDMGYTGDGARVGTKGGDGGPPVTPGGPGARAGIKAGDIITEVDGRPVRSGEELIVKTRAHRPGDLLELTLRRDGGERRVSLRLGSSGGN